MQIRHPNPLTRALLGLAASVILCATASARQGAAPYSLEHAAKVATVLPIVDVAAVDASNLRAIADARTKSTIGPHEKRLRIAGANAVAIAPERDGLWQSLADGSLLWRVEVRARGATDLHLGFGHYALPAGATLYAIGADGYYEGPYTAADATDDSLWMPMLPGDSAVVELRIPAGATLAPDALELDSIGAGFRDLFRRDKAVLYTGPGTSGACNVNVICPLGQPYDNEARAAAYYEFASTDPDTGEAGTYICTGTLMSDVPHDHKNYLLTAAHCVSSNTEAASMRVYWNYASSQCSATVGYTLADNQTGAHLRATRADVDFALVELSQVPDAAWHVYYAGWDASNVTPTGTIGLHHPNGDVEKVTAGPRPISIPNCIEPGRSITHWETGPYTQGTTEGGSSGSGLFVPSGSGGNQRLLIGTLSGGTAFCSDTDPTQPNDGTDCYGKLASGWDGTSAGSRLRDWLDPQTTGTLVNDGIDSQTAAPPADLPPGLATRAAAERAAQWRRLHGGRPLPPPPPSGPRRTTLSP